MKKLFSLLLVLSLVLSLTACGGAEPETQDKPAPAEPVQAAAEVTSQEAGSAEASQETAPATQPVPVIDRAPSNTWDTEAEIAAIAPVSGIYTQSEISAYTTYDYLVCRCITTDGGLVYVYLTVDDYIATFDADASVRSSYFAYSEMMVLESVLQIQGKSLEADSVVDGLSGDIGSDVMIHLGDVQPGTGTVEETLYTADMEPFTRVKADIVSIVPGYTLKIGTAAMNTDVVCSAETTDGSTIWVAMSIEAYNTHFDPDASLGIAGLNAFDTITFDGGVTLHGVSVTADDVASGLGDAIGSSTVFCFARKG